MLSINVLLGDYASPGRDYALEFRYTPILCGGLCLPREELCPRVHVQWGTMPAQGGTMPSSSCTLHKYTETLSLWVVYRDTESQSGTLTTVVLWPPNTWTYDLSHDVPRTNALAHSSFRKCFIWKHSDRNVGHKYQ